MCLVYIVALRPNIKLRALSTWVSISTYRARKTNVSESNYLVAQVYIKGEVCNESDHAFLIVQYTADQSFLIANVHWLCHLEV